MTGPAVHLRGVTIALGGTTIVRDLSFDVAPGSVHCVIGPNGGGKTSLMRAILGLVPHAGEIAIQSSAPITLGYAPQSLDLDRTMPLTVRDVMAVMNQRRPAFLGSSRRARADQDAALARLGLATKGDRLFGMLSGGERQRLLFAQALLPSPDLLIMDEATAHMDDEGARLVESIVADLAKHGTTVIWVSHDADQVRRVASATTRIARGHANAGARTVGVA